MMMDKLIIKLAFGEDVTDGDIANGLYEICDVVHSSCDSSCPIYKLNGNKVPHTPGNLYGDEYGCDCFKSGTEMLKFIRKHKNDP